LLPARLAGTLLGAFGILALLLAAVGIYGVIAYSVAQRTREIGVRMALGASARQLLALVTGEGAQLTGAWLAVGIIAAVGLMRFISSLLYGIRPGDLVSFIGAALVLTASAVLACYPSFEARNVGAESAATESATLPLEPVRIDMPAPAHPGLRPCSLRTAARWYDRPSRSRRV
jgi:hypothetical protein